MTYDLAIKIFDWCISKGFYYLAIFLVGCFIGGFFTYLVFIPALRTKYRLEYKKKFSKLYEIKEATVNCEYSNFNPHNYKTNVKIQNDKIVWLDCSCLDVSKQCINPQSPYYNKQCPYAKYIKYF